MQCNQVPSIDIHPFLSMTGDFFMINITVTLLKVIRSNVLQYVHKCAGFWDQARVWQARLKKCILGFRRQHRASGRGDSRGGLPRPKQEVPPFADEKDHGHFILSKTRNSTLMRRPLKSRVVEYMSRNVLLDTTSHLEHLPSAFPTFLLGKPPIWSRFRCWVLIC